MKVTTDKHFIYIGMIDSRQRDILLSEHNAVKVKSGYRLPKNIGVCRELYQQFPAIHDEVEIIGKGLRNELNALLTYRQASESETIRKRAGYNDDLREYQNSDIYYVSQLKAAGIFNEQRTGKTPTAIHLLKKFFEWEHKRTAIIISPASLIYNWQREFEKWTPGISTTVIAGTKAKREKGYANFEKGVLIISKDTLKQDKPTISFDVAIVDEAHFLRNWKTSQSKAVFAVKAERRYAMTGTPTVKHPSDIFGILHYLYPEKYPSYWQFADRYFVINDNYMGYKEVLSEKKHRIGELQEIIGTISVQRKRRDIMQWLPDKQRTTFYCEMGTKQQKAYREMLEYFFVEETELDAPSVLAQLIRLRQICLEPALLNIEAESAKTEALLEWIDDNKTAVVIMSMFTSYLKRLYKLLSDAGYKVGMITGEMTNADKMESATRFQNGQIDILLCNIISAGTGFTLDRADTIIFTDKAYNPAENEQAEDRITPTTPDKVHKHTIISFVCQNTVDEKINALLERKKSLTDLLNEGGMQAVKLLLSK